MGDGASVHAQRSVLYRLLIPSIVPLVCAVAAGFLSYNQALKVAEAGVHERNAEVLRGFCTTIDARLKEMDAISASLAWSPFINSFLRVTDPLEKSGFSLLRQTWRALPPYHHTNELIYDYFLYFNANNVMMSPVSVHVRLEQEYGWLFRYGDLSYADWLRQYFGTYHHREILGPVELWEQATSIEVLPYLRSIPMEYPRSLSGAVLILLDVRRIRELLPRNEPFDRSWVVVLDSMRNLVFSTGSVPPLLREHLEADGDPLSLVTLDPDGRTVVSYTRSDYNGWMYIAGVPRQYILEQISKARFLAILILVVSLCAGVVLAGILAHRTSLPFQSLIRKLQRMPDAKVSGEVDGIEFIESRVGEIMESNAELRKSLIDQMPLMRNAFLSRLLRGEVENDSEPESFASVVPLDLHARAYLCLAMEIEGYHDLAGKEVLIELNMTRALVKERVSRLLGGRCSVCEVDVRLLAAIVPLDDTDGEVVRGWVDEKCRRIIASLKDEYSVPLRIGVGRTVASLLDAYRSLHEAKQALWVELDGSSPVRWFQALPRERRGYSYPLETEIMLTNSVRSGQRDQAQAILRDVFAENFDHTGLGADMTRNLLFEVRGSFIKLFNRTVDSFSADATREVQRRIDELVPEAPLAVFHSVANSLIDLLARHFAERKKSHNRRRIEEILRYIDDNYGDRNISLTLLADHFKLSETYLSQFFKEQTGENFVNHLARLRLSHARRLLIESSLSIGEVSRAVGYQLPDSFARAFRRYFGVSPTVFREDR